MIILIILYRYSITYNYRIKHDTRYQTIIKSQVYIPSVPTQLNKLNKHKHT